MCPQFGHIIDFAPVRTLITKAMLKIDAIAPIKTASSASGLANT